MGSLSIHTLCTHNERTGTFLAHEWFAYRDVLHLAVATLSSYQSGPYATASNRVDAVAFPSSEHHPKIETKENERPIHHIIFEFPVSHTILQPMAYFSSQKRFHMGISSTTVTRRISRRRAATGCECPSSSDWFRDAKWKGIVVPCCPQVEALTDDFLAPVSYRKRACKPE